MTRRTKGDDERGLAGVEEDAFAQSRLEADVAEILTSPYVAEHDKHILHALLDGKRTFDEVVEVIATSPLMQSIKAVGRDLMVETGEDVMILALVLKSREFVDLVHSSSRKDADVSDLLAAAQSDPRAFDVCMAMWKFDQLRPGMPNWQLRRWRVSEPKRPFGPKRGTVKMRYRDGVLALLVADTGLFGFSPTRNAAPKKLRRCGCDIVIEALRAEGLPALTFDSLQGIWKKAKGDKANPWIRS